MISSIARASVISSAIVSEESENDSERTQPTQIAGCQNWKIQKDLAKTRKNSPRTRKTNFEESHSLRHHFKTPKILSNSADFRPIAA
jgi:hypothetical protein